MGVAYYGGTFGVILTVPSERARRKTELRVHVQAHCGLKDFKDKK